MVATSHWRVIIWRRSRQGCGNSSSGSSGRSSGGDPLLMGHLVVLLQILWLLLLMVEVVVMGVVLVGLILILEVAVVLDGLLLVLLLLLLHTKWDLAGQVAAGIPVGVVRRWVRQVELGCCDQLAASARGQLSEASLPLVTFIPTPSLKVRSLSSRPPNLRSGTTRPIRQGVWDVAAAHVDPAAVAAAAVAPNTTVRSALVG